MSVVSRASSSNFGRWRIRLLTYLIAFGMFVAMLSVIMFLGSGWAQNGDYGSIARLSFAMATVFFLRSLVNFCKEVGILKLNVPVPRTISSVFRTFVFQILAVVLIFLTSQIFIHNGMYMTFVNIACILLVLGVVMTAAKFLARFVKKLMLKSYLERLKKTPGADPLVIAMTSMKLGAVYFQQRKYIKAEALYNGALAIFESMDTPNIVQFSIALDRLASVYLRQNQFDKAEPLLQRVLMLHESTQERNISLFALRKTTLATVYGQQKKYSEAESLFREAVAMFERNPKQSKLYFSRCLKSYSNMLKVMHRVGEAKELMTRAHTIK